MKKRSLKKILCSMIIFAFVMIIGGCRGAVPEDTDVKQVGMFEWDESKIYQIEDAKELADKLDITHWYQEIDWAEEQAALKAFIKEMSRSSIDVYALVGETEWGYEEDGASLISSMKELADYNKSVSKEKMIKGIMVDIEPYVLKKWEDNKEANMDAYVSGMIKAYKYAQEKNLVFSICIPRHYDDQGLSSQLETLIAKGCDEVAVMDYDCGFEVEKIETEAALAEKYGKVLHCILEFQKVGKHGLVEEKTYWNKGLEEAWKAWDKVDKAYEGIKIIRDYHWSEPIEQILRTREEEEKSE